MNKWIKKMIYIYIFNGTIKKNEIMSFAGKWMELEIMINKISQTQTNISCFLSGVESRCFLKRHESRRRTI
jgi:hypothetical protein